MKEEGLQEKKTRQRLLKNEEGRRIRKQEEERKFVFQEEKTRDVKVGRTRCQGFSKRRKSYRLEGKR